MKNLFMNLGNIVKPFAIHLYQHWQMGGLIIMTAIFTIAGIAVISEMISKGMEYFGHGDKIVFIKVAGYIACGYIAWDAWWDGVRFVAHTFGVNI